MHGTTHTLHDSPLYRHSGRFGARFRLSSVTLWGPDDLDTVRINNLTRATSRAPGMSNRRCSAKLDSSHPEEGPNTSTCPCSTVRREIRREVERPHLDNEVLLRNQEASVDLVDAFIDDRYRLVFRDALEVFPVHDRQCEVCAVPMSPERHLFRKAATTPRGLSLSAGMEGGKGAPNWITS